MPAPRKTAPKPEAEDTQTPNLGNQLLDVKTALELAVASLAPTEVVDSLATAAGLLAALSEFPSDAAPVRATAPRAMTLAARALDAWTVWEAKPGRKPCV